MKRVCLVTWIGTGNYGTSLQSYALHKILEIEGYEVTFIHAFNEKEFAFRNKLKVFLFDKFKAIIKTFLNPIGCTQKKMKDNKLQQFNQDNYHSIHVRSRNSLRNLLNTTEVFITGSDQIWNCYHSFNPFFFLSFAADVKRVAYASSIGTKDFPESYKSHVREYLMKFSHIGVRENAAVLAISNLMKPNRKDVKQVADPTFLLDKKHWLSFAGKANIEIELPQKYILCYFIGSDSFSVDNLCCIKKELGIEDVVLIPSLENQETVIPSTMVYNAAGPYEFVKLIANAECICTDSFHATALSINLEKNFIEFKRFKDTDEFSQNSRIYELLDAYGLRNRLWDENSNNVFSKIRYEKVTPLVRKVRVESTEYLNSSINH